MPRKEYQQEFVARLDPDGEETGDDWLRYRIDTARGRVTDFVLQYEAVIDGRRYQVVRFDCAHGQPHRDTLDGRERVVEKFWLPAGLSLGDALQWANRDLRANWRRYRAEFIQRLQGNRRQR